jgi:polar amino acid transport system substrate-binding protein
MRRHLLAAALLAATLAGCAATSDHALRLTLAALGTPAPQPAQTSSAAGPVHCGDVTASLRPPGATPAPGKMPAGSFMATIERRGYLLAGVDQNTLLFSYFNPLDSQFKGFEIDLLRQLAGAIFGDPNKIEFRAITTAERIPAVQSGAVDVVADAATITCERRALVDFSTVYFDAGQRLLVPLDSRIGNVRDLAGKRVCATIGSTSITTLHQVAPRAIRYPVKQRTDCLVALQQGQVDAVTSDDSILLSFQAQDPNTKLVGSRFQDEPYGMAISKAHPDFVRFVNGVLDRIRADGSWTRIYSRWLGRFAAPPAPPRPHYSG